MLPGIRRQVMVRLAACGVALALIAGLASYLIEIAQLDRLVYQMATQQANHLVHSIEQAPAHADQPALDLGGFVFTRVTAGDKERKSEEWRPDASDSLRVRLLELLAKDGPGERHVNFRHDDRLYMFLSFDLDRKDGRFTGLYQVDETLDKALGRQVMWSVVGVFLAVVLSTGILVPILLVLESSVIRHARDAVDANVDALVTLGNAIAQRDSDTDAHNYRVTLSAIRLAEHLGLEDEFIRQLIRGAFLHDVGKIGIPDAILLKPGRLTSEEFAVMESHVRRGLEIVAQSWWLTSAATVIGGHHEKFDGTGYPNGLVGEAIPLAARVFAVVDVFDALISERPYKEAFTLERACKLMLEGRDRHFDPQILDSFLQIVAAFYEESCTVDEECTRRALKEELRGRFV